MGWQHGMPGAGRPRNANDVWPSLQTTGKGNRKSGRQTTGMAGGVQREDSERQRRVTRVGGPCRGCLEDCGIRLRQDSQGPPYGGEATSVAARSIGRTTAVARQDRPCGSGFGPLETPRWSVVLEVPGIVDPVVEDGAAGAVIEQEGEVLAGDRLPPPFVLDDPGVLDALDLMVCRLMTTAGWRWPWQTMTGTGDSGVVADQGVPAFGNAGPWFNLHDVVEG